jgi:disulfide oxidoreductase YuzD
MVAEMPFGEKINNIFYYLGYLVITTDKGIRIATVTQAGYQQGNITYGPMLFESNYPAYGVVANEQYVWVSTSVAGSDGLPNACLVRIDLSTQFEDGTFPYAYDLEYESDDPSYGVGVVYADNRLHILVNEGTSAGEIQTEHTTDKRTTGWLQTGFIRYGTVQPKYFKYIEVTANVTQNDTISVESVSSSNTAYSLISLNSQSANELISIRYPIGKQELLGFKFTFTNGSPLSGVPTLQSYQVKSIPAMPRQRLIQYPLGCYDIEMDRYNTTFGYIGSAYERLQSLENMEGNGDSVVIEDYRTGEKFSAIIEEVRFTNESSADKNSSGFGGTLLVTVRKM